MTPLAPSGHSPSPLPQAHTSSFFFEWSPSNPYPPVRHHHQVERVRAEMMQDLAELKTVLPEVHHLMAGLAASSSSLSLTLKAILDKLQAKEPVATQTDVEVESSWIMYLHSLPKVGGQVTRKQCT